jgi:hypothetical protein
MLSYTGVLAVWGLIASFHNGILGTNGMEIPPNDAALHLGLV